MVTKKAAITGVVVILAVIGAIIGVLVVRKSSDSASESSGTKSSGSGSVSDSSGSRGTTSSIVDSSSSKSGTTYKLKNSTSSSSSSVTSDPTDAKFTLSAFAIGDWGTTVTQDSCCTRSSTSTASCPWRRLRSG
ncbi:hypothetical protein PF006_g23971 [Phytophthora fragariae]|uniref:Uncharacterized protein n=1 Tax=Phytophthora fragariae TaxID=53985 RepID=A0A6A3RKY4_9STRA|nr:hypothetical protein PF006_g23971 [Phytophthora fragariae]